MTRVQADEFRPIHFALQEIMTTKILSEQNDSMAFSTRSIQRIQIPPRL